MQIIYGKKLDDSDRKQIQNIALECGILFDTARLLFYRNIDTVQKVKRFFNAGKKGFYNPYLLSGMSEAVDRIIVAMTHNQNVVVFGDYDADGICATTVLYYSLGELGIKNIRKIVPERDDGYGLNVETVKKLNQEERVDLLITVDCGISDKEKIEQIKKLGIDVIVTDHHEPPEDLPDCIKINPKLSGQEYPFSGLCGAGVAYKLSSALISDNADKYLDIVALATVADSMDLVDENRDIVVEGLKLFNNPKKQRLLFKYMLPDNFKEITAQTLAYNVAPRINAGGRMGDAACALRAFTSDKENEIFDLSVKLNEYNLARQVECDNIYRQAKEKIERHNLYRDDVILVKDKNWQVGFIGIVAARLVEEYSRPVIVFAGHDGYLKGSARSVEDINIHDAIVSAKDILLGFGGHAQAAGISVTEENFMPLVKELNQFVRSNYGKIDTTPKIYADWEIDTPFSLAFAREIERLEPFGIGNKKPLFVLNVNRTVSKPLKQGSPHYSFDTDVVEMLDFNGGKHVKELLLPIDKKVLFELNLTSFRGKESVKGYVRGVYALNPKLDNLSLYSFEEQLELIKGEKGQGKITYLTSKEINFDDKNRTVYVIGDIENLSRYDQSKKLISVVYQDKIKGNELTSLGLNQLPTQVKRLVYLDQPIKEKVGDFETVVVTDLIGYKKIIDRISVRREDFATIFNQLVQLKGKEYYGSADFSLRYAGETDEFMFTFALEVFIELGIFGTENHKLTYNENVKNALTNSKVYSKINLIKG